MSATDVPRKEFAKQFMRGRKAHERLRPALKGISEGNR